MCVFSCMYFSSSWVSEELELRDIFVHSYHTNNKEPSCCSRLHIPGTLQIFITFFLVSLYLRYHTSSHFKAEMNSFDGFSSHRHRCILLYLFYTPSIHLYFLLKIRLYELAKFPGFLKHFNFCFVSCIYHVPQKVYEHPSYSFGSTEGVRTSFLLFWCTFAILILSSQSL